MIAIGAGAVVAWFVCLRGGTQQNNINLSHYAAAQLAPVQRGKKMKIVSSNSLCCSADELYPSYSSECPFIRVPAESSASCTCGNFENLNKKKKSNSSTEMTAFISQTQIEMEDEAARRSLSLAA